MKIFPVKLHRAAFFFSVVLSLFTSAKEEDHSLQNSEYKTMKYYRYITILQPTKRCLQQSRAIINGIARLSPMFGLRQGKN